MISRTHAVLFTKDKCKPCTETKEHAIDLLEHNLALNGILSFMKKENHSALVAAYNLNKYPTLLIVGANGIELDRVEGGAAIRDCIEAKLISIHQENSQ